MLGAFFPRTHSDVHDVLTDDGKFLVKDYSHLAYPPLRSYVLDFGRLPGSLGTNSTPVMAYVPASLSGTDNKQFQFSWGWPSPDADPITSLTFTSVYWQDLATMRAAQSIAGGTYHATRAHTDLADDVGIVVDIEPAGHSIPVIADADQVKHFATFLPAALSYEFFVAGEIVNDSSLDIDSWHLLADGNYATVNLTFADKHTRSCYYWGGSSWLAGGHFFTGGAAAPRDLGPGYFEINMALADLVRQEPNAYVDLTNPNTFAFPPQVPSFDPSTNGGVYPDVDANGLVRVGSFDAQNLVGITINAVPATTDTTENLAVALKLNLKTARFRPSTAHVGLHYVDDYYLVNSPAGEPLPFALAAPIHLGEGYQLNLDVASTHSFSYLGAPNRWPTSAAYPTTMYARFTPLANAVDSDEPDGNIVTLGGASTSPAAYGIAVRGGYPYLFKDDPNFDGFTAPVILGGPGTWTVEADDITVMDAVPPLLIGTRFADAQWRLINGQTYEMAAVFTSGTLPLTVGGQPDTSARCNIKLYMIESGHAYLVGWLRPDSTPSAGVTSTGKLDMGLKGTAPEVAIGANNDRGGGGNIFPGSILQTRLYSHSLTTAQLLQIDHTSPASDPTRSLMDQWWNLPIASSHWLGPVDPSFQAGTVYPSGDGTDSDDMIIKQTVPALSGEVRDPLSTGFLDKLQFGGNVPVDNSTHSYQIDFSQSPTPGGRLIEASNITNILLSASNAPADAIVIEKLWFKQLQHVIAYLPQALPYTDTEGAFNPGTLKSLYFRLINNGSATTGAATFQISVWDAAGPTDPFVFPVSLTAIPAPAATYFDEIPTERFISVAGRLLDTTQLVEVKVEQLTGPTLQLDRLDYRGTANIFQSTPLDLTSGPYDRNWSSPTYLNLPAGKSLQFVIEGVNNTALTQMVDFRLDDQTTTDAIAAGTGNFFERFDIAFDTTPNSSFQITVPIDGLKSNDTVHTRLMDLTKITKLNISGDVTITLFRVEQGFQFANGRGWHFIDDVSTAIPGFSSVNVTFKAPVNGAGVANQLWYDRTNATPYSYDTTAGTWSADATLIQPYAGMGILSRSLPSDRDLIANSAIEGVGTFRTTGWTPGASYHALVWREFAGFFQDIPRYLKSTLTVGGAVLDATDYTTDVEGWYKARYLRGQDVEVDVINPSVTPYDLYGQYHGRPVDGVVTADSSGFIDLVYSEADSSFGTELATVLIEPNAARSDSLTYLALRRQGFNNIWSQGAPLTMWPTTAAGTVLLREVPLIDLIREPTDFVAASGPRAHVMVPGIQEHFLFIALSGSTDAAATMAISGLPAGFSAKLRWGQWTNTRSGNTLLNPDASYMRGDGTFNMVANRPRPIGVELIGATAGVHTATLTVTVAGVAATATLTFTVLAKTLPAHNKPVGMYYFGNYRSQFGNTSAPLYADWQQGITDDLAALTETGSNSIAASYFDDPTTTLPPTTVYGSGFTTSMDQFLAQLRDYKARGFGAQPWFQYQAWKFLIWHMAGGTLIDDSAGIDSGWFAKTVVFDTIAPSDGYLNSESDLVALHNAYRTSLGITDATDTLISSSGNIVLDKTKLHMTINGQVKDGNTTTQSSGFFRYNQDDFFEVATPDMGGQNILAGDRIILSYDMSNYSDLRAHGIDVTQQRIWLMNRMRTAMNPGAAQIASAMAVLRADPTNYPVEPYFAIADEPKVQHSGSAYLPTADVDFVLAAGLTAHAHGLKTIGAINGAGDLSIFTGILDALQLNGGWGSVTATTIASVRSAFISPWIYNEGNLRAQVGFFLWRLGHDGYVDFASNSFNVRPFDPTDGNEADSNNIFPMGLAPAVSSVSSTMLGFSMGVTDYRWCLWLDAQTGSGAAAVKAAVQALIPAVMSTAEALTGDQMDAARRLITDYAATH